MSEEASEADDLEGYKDRIEAIVEDRRDLFDRLA
jgi:hypothetical protein